MQYLLRASRFDLMDATGSSGNSLRFYFTSTIKIMQCLLAWFPLVWLLSLYLLALRAASVLNRLPTYSNPDPKNLPFDIHYSLTFFGLLGALYAIVLFPVVATMSIKVLPVKRHLWIAYVIGAIAVAIQLYYDPYGLINWLLD